MASRYINNPFADYSSSTLMSVYLDPNTNKLSDTWDRHIRYCFNRLYKQFEYGLKNEVNPKDISVYTGISGIALLFFRMYEKLDDKTYLRRAIELIEPTSKHLKGKHFSFLCGDSGPLACATVFYHYLGNRRKSRENLKRLLDLSEDVSENDEIPDELLYGRSGYLYSLLFVRQHVEDAVSTNVVEEVADAIIKSGVNLSHREKSDSPLMFMWDESYYLGAAHGLAGIYFMLMKVGKCKSDDKIKSLIKRSIDYLITLKFPSGNYPSWISTPKETDELVHWCHGAPGFVHMFLEAFEVFGEEVYLNEAKSCADVIWKRGLLKKGYGLCHGAAGNGYAFLMLYQTTHDMKYLHRALKFAEWIFSYGKHGCRIADRPYSLFEGLAGTLYYLLDLIHPLEANFPAFY